MKEYYCIFYYGLDGSEYFIDEIYNLYYVSYCFNYLRQGILCSMDSILEGLGEGFGVVDGFGQFYICRDWGEVILWLELSRWDIIYVIDSI